MKLSKERLEAYASKIGQTPEEQINEYLSVNCESYKGNEDKLPRAISHLQSVIRELPNANREGMAAVPDMVVFIICQDYFNQEMWKAEDEEAAKAKKEAEERAAKAKADKEAKAKKAEDKKKAEEEKQKAKDSQLDLFGSGGQATPDENASATSEPAAEPSPDADNDDDEVVEEEEENDD